MGKGQPNVSNSIRTLRFHAGEMTQAALAEKVGETVSKGINGVGGGLAAFAN